MNFSMLLHYLMRILLLVHLEQLEYETEKAMAPQSSTLAWQIPGQRSLVGCSPCGRDFTFTFHFRALEKEMATHSSVLAWRIPGMGEPGGLLSVGLH